jgi:hypothetical protein
VRAEGVAQALPGAQRVAERIREPQRQDAAEHDRADLGRAIGVGSLEADERGRQCKHACLQGAPQSGAPLAVPR